MIVPVFACLHALAATDASDGIKENTSRLAVLEASRGNQVTVLFKQTLDLIVGHDRPFSNQRYSQGTFITCVLGPSTLLSRLRNSKWANRFPIWGQPHHGGLIVYFI